jgi:hypothetical protein
MRAKTGFALLALVMYAAVATAQDRVSLRPIFKVGDQSRYIIKASVETIITPKGSDGLGGTSRGELSATVAVRTISLGAEGEVNQEAVVEAISFSSSVGKGGVVSPPSPNEIAGRTIEFAMTPSGRLLRCSIPESPGYLTLADLLFSVARWYPAGEVAVGESWEAIGQGHMYTARLSEISTGARTVYKLASSTKGVASIDGAVTLTQSGSSVFNAGGGLINVSVIASGKGTTHIDWDVSVGHIIGGSTESRVEGTLVNIQPTAASEKMHTREGSLVETSTFSIKLIQ